MSFTPVPNALIDILLPSLSEAELKVTLYIARRTLGFAKQSDAISLSQLQHGIFTRDGRQLDSGTGLTRKWVVAAIKSLESRGVLETVRGTENGFSATNTYCLKLEGGSIQKKLGVVSKRNPQEKVVQKKEKLLKPVHQDAPEKSDKILERKAMPVIKGKVPMDSSKALALVKEKADIDLGPVLKTLNITKVWQHFMLLHFDINPMVVGLKQKESGQFKLFQKTAGMEAGPTIEWAVSNWKEFCNKVRNDYAVATAPKVPEIGFLLKWAAVAVDMQLKSKLPKAPELHLSADLKPMPKVKQKQQEKPVTLEEFQKLTGFTPGD
jgi:hypothetical protein